MAIAIGEKLAARAALGDRLRQAAESIVIPILALIAAMILFGIFVALSRVNPFDLYAVMYRGAFGTWFSWQNTLTRAAPLILTALCTALPAQLGMVIIGGEGAFVMGGLAATATALALPGAPPLVVQLAMAASGMAAGGFWIALSGGLRHYRGVNETISSLLLVYIALAILNHLVEGPMRDPASLNKPSTREIGAANMIGAIPGTDIHWGLVFGIVAAPGDIRQDAQVLAAGHLVRVADEDLWTINSPIELAGQQKVPPRRAPAVGEHSDQVLREAGYGESEIRALRQAGAIG